MKNHKMCAWISRHKPTRAQEADLKRGGYIIRIVNPPDRITSSRWAWTLAQNACGGIPDLVVVVMPLNILNYFLREVSEQTVVVRAPAQKSGEYAHDWEWSGHWQRIKAVKVVTEPWSPVGDMT